MGWKIYDEAVEMVRRRFGYYPRVFRWRGRCFRVYDVERCWTRSRRGTRHDRRRRVERHFFQVRCDEGTFEVYQDLRANTWHLRRAKLRSGRRALLRRSALMWRQEAL
jgi:hypothetical protein